MNSYSKDLKKVKNHLKENPQGLTVSQIADFLNVNRNSVAKYMDVLSISGQVEMRQIGPAKLYVLSSSVPTADLLDYSNDAMIFFDEELYIIKYNKKFKELFDFEEDEINGKKFYDLKKEFFISDQFLLDWRKLQEIGSAVNTIKIEYENTRKFLKYRLFKTIFENAKQGIGLIICDITPTKEREIDLKFRVRFDELIATIATEFIGTQKKDVPIEVFRALKKIGEVGEVDRAFIYFFSKDLTQAISPHHWSKNPEHTKEFKDQLDLTQAKSWVNELFQYEPVYIYQGDKIEKDKKQFLKKLDLTTIAIVPLISDGNLVGCLGVGMADNSRVWTQKTTSMLTMTAKVFVEVFKKYEILDEYYK